MNRIVIAAVLLAGGGSFLAGRQSVAKGQTASLAAGPQRNDPVLLPDPRLLASSARMEVERISPAIWSAAAGPTAAEAGQSLAIAGTTGAMLARPSAIPERPASGARREQAPLPARAPAEQETPAEIVQALSQSISAIVRSNGAARLVIADPATTVRRSLVPGDVFLAGWKVSRIDPGVVTLTKQGRSIAVPVAYSAKPIRTLALGPTGTSTSKMMPTAGSTVPGANRPQASAPRRRISRRDTAEN